MVEPTHNLRIKIPQIREEDFEDEQTPRIKRHKLCDQEESCSGKMLYCFFILYHFMTKI
jgi:hypothetical protein